MKSNIRIIRLFQGHLAAALLLATISSQLSTVHAQTPIPGPGYTIRQPGSYCLTRNLTVSSGNCLTIATNCVTLDLRGFTISSTSPSPSGAGILLKGNLHNITIQNGFIDSGVVHSGGSFHGSGFQHGIMVSFIEAMPECKNIRVCGVSVSGVSWDGIYLGRGNASLVEDCTVTTAGYVGVLASIIKDTVVMDCAVNAIMGDQATDCYGQSTGSLGGYNGIDVVNALNCYGRSANGFGVLASTALNCVGVGASGGVSGSTLENCYGGSANGMGVSGYTVQNCWGNANNGGIGVNAMSSALNCYGTSSSAAGISATNALNCYGTSTTADGVDAATVQNCYGLSATNYGAGLGGNITYGVNATAAQNCYGQSGGNGNELASSAGVNASAAQNCYGLSIGYGFGVYAANVAQNCYGESALFYGLYANLLNSCQGNNDLPQSFPGLWASWANFCVGYPSEQVDNQKYNMQ